MLLQSIQGSKKSNLVLPGAHFTMVSFVWDCNFNA